MGSASPRDQCQTASSSPRAAAGADPGDVETPPPRSGRGAIARSGAGARSGLAPARQGWASKVPVASILIVPSWLGSCVQVNVALPPVLSTFSMVMEHSPAIELNGT
jgi:hypothetical protein